MVTKTKNKKGIILIAIIILVTITTNLTSAANLIESVWGTTTGSISPDNANYGYLFKVNQQINLYNAILVDNVDYTGTQCLLYDATNNASLILLENITVVAGTGNNRSCNLASPKLLNTSNTYFISYGSVTAANKNNYVSTGGKTYPVNLTNINYVSGLHYRTGNTIGGTVYGFYWTIYALNTSTPTTPPNSTMTNITFDLKSEYNNSAINNITLTIQNNATTYTTTNGTIIIELNVSKTYNLSYSSNGFYQKNYTNMNLSNGTHTGITQQYSITANEPIVNYTTPLLKEYNLTITPNITYNGFPITQTIYEINNTLDGIKQNTTNNNYTTNTSDLFDTIKITTISCTIYQCNRSQTKTLIDTVNEYLYFNSTNHLNQLITTNLLWNFTNSSIETSGNPLLILASLILNSTNKNKNETITIRDTSNYYVNKTTTITINENTTNYTIQLEPNKLALYFYQDGILTTTSGFVSDEQPSTRGFNSTNVVIIQQNLSTGKVSVIFNNINNWTQYYEYINDYTTYINESLEIIPVTNLWGIEILTVDYANSPIENAIVRAEYTIPVINQNKTGVVMGQRLTNPDGHTFFNTDKSAQILLTISKNGYEPYMSLISVGDTQYTYEVPMTIYLKQNPNGVKDNAWKYITNKFTNRTKTIKGTIVAKDRTKIEIQTTYRETLGLGRKDVTNTITWFGGHEFELIPSTDFSSTGTSDINLTIYLDNEVWENIIIKYEQPETNEIFTPTTNESTKTGTIFQIIGLLTIVTLFGLIFRNQRVGFHTYMVGIIILTIINPIYFAYLGIISTLYYMSRLIHKIIGGE